MAQGVLVMKKILVVFLSICLALGSCAGAFAAAPVGSALTKTAAGRDTPVPTRDPYSHSAFAPTKDPYSHSVSVTTPTPDPKPTLSPEQKKRLAQLENELKELKKRKERLEKIVAPYKAMARFMVLLVGLHKTYGIKPAVIIGLMMRLRLPIPIVIRPLDDLLDAVRHINDIERIEEGMAQIEKEIKKIKEGKV